jgi:ubiquinone/menaquinone biosynthesis C-methylase UbiE
MESSAIDPVAFRDTQKESWDDAAPGWKKWSEWWDRYASNVSERLVELARVEPGSHVLDVAAGYGEPALTAARKAAPEGRVVATDISAEMLAFGRDRAAEAGVENLEFMQSDANSLDFPHESFDAAVSRWGIIFEPDGEGTAERIRGFLKPGSRFAISSWGPAERSPLLGLPMKAVLDVLDQDPPPPGTPGPLSRPTPEAIGALLEGGGFSAVQTEDMELTAEWTSPEEFAVYVKEVIAPITRMVEAHPPHKQEQAWNAVADSVRDHSGPDGTIRLDNQVLFAVGSA